jgi:hypothetical protein
LVLVLIAEGPKTMTCGIADLAAKDVAAEMDDKIETALPDPSGVQQIEDKSIGTDFG